MTRRLLDKSIESAAVVASDKHRRILNWLSSQRNPQVNSSALSGAVHEKGRRAVARAALSFVNPGETVLFDDSLMALELAKILPDIEITVLTPSLKVIAELAGRQQLRLVLMGGKMDSRSLSCRGPLLQQALERYHLHKAFLSYGNGDRKNPSPSHEEDKIAWQKSIMELSGHTYFMVESCHLNLAEDFVFHSQQPKTLITSGDPSREIKKKLKNMNISFVHARENGESK